MSVNFPHSSFIVLTDISGKLTLPLLYIIYYSYYISFVSVSLSFPSMITHMKYTLLLLFSPTSQASAYTMHRPPQTKKSWKIQNHKWNAKFEKGCMLQGCNGKCYIKISQRRRIWLHPLQLIAFDYVAAGPAWQSGFQPMSTCVCFSWHLLQHRADLMEFQPAPAPPCCWFQSARFNLSQLGFAGPWQAPIYVSNKKSWILPKTIHFSSPFIHISWVHSGCTPAFSDCWASGSQNVRWVRPPRQVWLGLWKTVLRTPGKYVHKTLPNCLSLVLKPMAGQHCTGGQSRVQKKTTKSQLQLDSNTDRTPALIIGPLQPGWQSNLPCMPTWHVRGSDLLHFVHRLSIQFRHLMG
jgi:hypothetical protein